MSELEAGCRGDSTPTRDSRNSLCRRDDIRVACARRPPVMTPAVCMSIIGQQRGRVRSCQNQHNRRGTAFCLNGGSDRRRRQRLHDMIAVFRVARMRRRCSLGYWETTGIDTDGNGTIDLDLPALGANPQRKNLFLEIDWMDCAVAGGDCAAGDTHSHRPLNAAVTAVVNAFANAATVTNPDGSTGITLRIDVGNSIAHQNALNIPGLCFNGGAGIGTSTR